MDPARFREVVVPSAGALATTQFAPDETNESDSRLDGEGLLVEPLHVQEVPGETEKPQVEQPVAPVTVVAKPVWHLSSASFYGPGFYGKRTACGLALTTTLIGVAHRTLPCGTLITFRNRANGRILTVPVVDRGPYVSGREWDLTGGACVALDFCYTARIYWKYAE
jgi:rare lipoprotein A (peptidoglycan hydrolase)